MLLSENGQYNFWISRGAARHLLVRWCARFGPSLSNWEQRTIPAIMGKKL